jgi:Ras GTPase-activating-like protein IQGAP2/3
MQNKKASLYGDGGRGVRKLGNHLPRIASGDGDEHWQEDTPPKSADVTPRRSRRPKDLPLQDGELSPRKEASPNDVAGIPGRLRLARDKPPSNPSTPLPSAKLKGGLWADVQRHLLQTYEYLCHVGEAQQWIEGCLGEELGFGVVEMDEGLRNGVVLAKLVRVFRGEAAVKKIYDVCTHRIFVPKKTNLRSFIGSSVGFSALG